MVRTTSAFFLMRWTKRGLGLWSTWRLVRGILRQSAVR
ncbi:Inner membrane protein YqjK [Klebsiella pneumoniae IS43]|uniref:Inner membrane protein YqjK n=1 Tax=Klebsiella pneumoniae IS43 TaxID=1432552 RepID=W1DP22_KLEPN|nr:Inner membrane protein YqjK [Klebsiella pneumoniae IS43]